MMKSLKYRLVFSVVIVTCATSCRPSSNAAEEQKKGAQADQAPVQARLEQAVNAVIAAGTASVAAAKDDQSAVVKVQQSLEAIRLIGQLGDFNTEAQTAKLMDELRESARPSVVEAIVRTQFELRLRMWQQLNSAERAEAVNSFVAGMKKAEISPVHAEMLTRLANYQDILDDSDQSRLASNAITALMPQFQALDAARGNRSGNGASKQYAPRLAGIVRRFDLIGKPMVLEGKLLDGTPFDWNSYRGKVVLVDFHASWCGPCRQEVPNVLKAYEAYHDKGFEVVGVNLDTEPQLAEKYIQETGAKFPTIFSDDPAANGWNAPMVTYYGVTAIPRVLLVDKDGKVVSTNARGAKLGQLLEKLLGPPGGAAATQSSSDQSRDEKGQVIQASATEEATDTPAPPEEGADKVEAAPAVPE